MHSFITELVKSRKAKAQVKKDVIRQVKSKLLLYQHISDHEPIEQLDPKEVAQETAQADTTFQEKDPGEIYLNSLIEGKPYFGLCDLGAEVNVEIHNPFGICV